jgi:DNA-binding transcriptional LysR family regulator
VNETTVARRLRVLEQGLSAQLFVRDASGNYAATDVAKGLIGHAETIEQENLAIGEVLGRTSERLAGTVRISAVPIVVNKILVPHLHGLRHQYPLLTVELVPEPRNVDLTKRESDLAIRLARPSSGGLDIKAQKIGVLEFSIFGPAFGDADLDWIGYDDAHSHLPQARWLKSVKGSGHAFLRVADAETALEAVACGLGVSLLPRLAAAADPRQREVCDVVPASVLVRPVWLLSHVSQRMRASVSVTRDWLMTLPWKDAP